MNITTYEEAEKFVLEFLKRRVKTKISKRKIRNLQRDENGNWWCYYHDEGYPSLLKFINYLLIFLSLLLTTGGFFSCFVWTLILGNMPDPKLEHSPEHRFFLGIFVLGLLIYIIQQAFYYMYYEKRFVSEIHSIRFSPNGHIISYNFISQGHFPQNLPPFGESLDNPFEDWDENEIPPAE